LPANTCGGQQGNQNGYTTGLFDDLVAAGALGFCEALCRFDLNLGWRFNSYARHRISGAISDEAVRFRKRGIKSETDTHRWLFRHRSFEKNLKLKRPIFKSFREFAEAFGAVEAWGQGQSYADDPRSGDSNDLRRGDAEHKEFKPEKHGEVDRWAAAQIYDCFNPHQLSNLRRRHEQPSRLIDGMAVDADRRARQRLKVMGRRAYALELVEGHHARVEAAEKRDAAEWAASRGVVIDAAPIARRRKHVGPRRNSTKIRSWRAPPKAAAA
jgi:hypothetical protein